MYAQQPVGEVNGASAKRIGRASLHDLWKPLVLLPDELTGSACP
ncbi:hypothetical protein RLPCCGM1_p0112 [Rhizobium leguminosarum bv. phaseoli CCGM1]|nr:hypothetical protein RLPCCGM1_p0112 [Rhizobium leguminosarum bv. phaseoli CCGM1]